MSNTKKTATLGMPHGTANSRLKKNILFHLLKKLKENVCFVCSKDIEVVEDLSIEHKLPWEGRSAELFWDLENIAFSHLRCNRPHIHNGGSLRKLSGPEGTSWCTGHKEFLPIGSFYKTVARWNGLQVNCKECHDVKRGRKSFSGVLAHSAERRTCNSEAVGA
jgi:hypothetical protein